MIKRSVSFVLAVGMSVSLSAQTSVPANGRNLDANGNGYPDAGVVVNGHYESLYAYDGDGAWYWDLGDGRVFGTVSDVSELDQDTLTTCDYVNNYRGTFEDNPFMDTGWIQNHIVCTGVDQGAFQYLIVHETDPRYTGNPEWEIWGTWEYHVLTESGNGNILRKLPRP